GIAFVSYGKVIGKSPMPAKGANTMTDTPSILEAPGQTAASSTQNPAAPRFKGYDLTARHLAAMVHLSEDERHLIREAVTVNLDFVKNDLFKQADAEQKLFGGDPIEAASTSWYHPMVDDELIGQAAPSSSLLTTEQEKQLFLRYNYARSRAQAAVKKFRTHPG